MSEVANLKVSDIDSQRMTLRVEQRLGQRGSVRDALAATARTAARLVRRGGVAAGLALSRPEPGQPDVRPPAEGKAHTAASLAGIAKRVSPHTFWVFIVPSALRNPAAVAASDP